MVWLWLTQAAVAAPGWEAQAQEAWARLYGYVRWFHPADELQEIDLDALACTGAARASDAADPEALAETLNALLAPVAPGVQVWWAGGQTTPPLLRAEDGPRKARPIAWQHRGMGQGVAGPYVSVRSGRKAEVSSGARFGPISQSVPAEALRGRRIRLAAAGRAAVPEGSALQLWMRVDRPEGGTGFFDNMDDRPITSPAWGTYTIEGEVDADAERVVVGAMLVGTGEAWADAFTLEVQGDDGWRPIEILAPGFEKGLDGWHFGVRGYDFGRDKGAAEGKRSLHISTSERRVPPPFDHVPPFGTRVERELVPGVWARVPTVLLDGPDGTWPVGTGPLPELSCDDPLSTHLADVAVTWNVIQHFSPYHDVVEPDWEAALPAAIARALDGDDPLRNLELLIAETDDGHGWVTHADHTPRAGVPVQLEWVEDQLVVLSSAEPLVEPGDALLAIDGVEVHELWEEAWARTAGSPQLRQVRAPARLCRGHEGEEVTWTVDRDGEEVELALTLGDVQAPPPFPRPELERLDDGVIVVDLNTVRWAELQPLLDELAAAPGVIFDIRQYPTDAGHQLLAHLLDAPETAKWMAMPDFVAPDHEVYHWQEVGWQVKPAAPHLGGERAFLITSRAVSYAESVLGYVVAHDLGELVGQTTAAANGNVNPFRTPGGFMVSWTGMRVTRHDGGQQHVVGIAPTVPVELTREGVREGRDEILEAALAAVRDRL